MACSRARGQRVHANMLLTAVQLNLTCCPDSWSQDTDMACHQGIALQGVEDCDAGLQLGQVQEQCCL